MYTWMDTTATLCVHPRVVVSMAHTFYGKTDAATPAKAKNLDEMILLNHIVVCTI